MPEPNMTSIGQKEAGPRVLHVCTFEGGGAAIAAKRQSEGLRRIGCDSTFFAIRLADNDDFDWTIGDGEMFLHVPREIWSYTGSITTNYCVGNRTIISNTWFSLWPTETELDEKLYALFSTYDVVHLHWTTGLVSTRLVQWLATWPGKVFITSHDMNYFTGGCHYNAGCRRFEKGCNECPQLSKDPLRLVEAGFKTKTDSLRDLDATWLFPSRWLKDEFDRSVLRGEDSRVLSNCGNTDLFRPAAENLRQQLRQARGFGPDDVVIIAGAQDNRERRKGFTVLDRALKGLGSASPQACEIKVVTFGGGGCTFSAGTEATHVDVGPVNETEVAELLRSADLLAFPSLEDNLPNVVLEAVLCGCPALALDVGGVGDLVYHGENGYLVRPRSIAAYRHALHELLENDRLSSLRDSTRKWAMAAAEQFSQESNGRALLAEYTKTRCAQAKSEREDSDKTSSMEPDDRIYSRIFALPRQHNRQHGYRFARRLRTYREGCSRAGTESAGLQGTVAGTLWFDMPELENTESSGAVRWAKTDNPIAFVTVDVSQHELVVQIPRTGIADEVWRKMRNEIRVTVNDHECDRAGQYELDHGLYRYVCVPLPLEHLASLGAPNIVSIRVQEPYVEYAVDPRGLGFLFSAIGIKSAGVTDCANESPLLGLWLAGCGGESTSETTALMDAVSEMLNEAEQASASRVTSCE